MSEPSRRPTKENLDVSTGGGAFIGGGVEANTFIGRDAYYGYSAAEVRQLLAEMRQADHPHTWDGRQPYLGLDAFHSEDAEFFFGREQLVEKILVRLQTSRFVCIAGPSGSGKSSLARAGVMHALAKARLPRSDRWLLADLTPGRKPIAQLASALERATKTPRAADYLRAHGGAEPSALHEQVEALLTSDQRQRCVILVDQFEELFTETIDPNERTAFINLLCSAAASDAGRSTYIITLRADFVSHCVEYPPLRDLISEQFQLVGAMEPAELAKAISLPAMKVGAIIEPELTSRVIADMAGEPGALPLMQFALEELFRAQSPMPDGNVALKLQDYLDQGGVSQALERHAQVVFAGMTDEQHKLALKLFSRLVNVDRSGAATRRTVDVADLAAIDDDIASVIELIRRLAASDARLLVLDDPRTRFALQDHTLDDVDNQILVESSVSLAHERLIEAWPWLRNLVEENRQALALQSLIREDAATWEENDHDPGYLYQGARLTYALDKIEKTQIEFGNKSQHFLLASHAFEELPNVLHKANQAASKGDFARAIKNLATVSNWMKSGLNLQE